MDLKNVKSKLDKVNRFYDYLSNNEDVVSRIDKEAFLGAIRSLYDACFEEEKPKEDVAPKAEPTPQPKEEISTKKKKKKLVFTNNNETKKATESKPVPEVVKPTNKIEQQPIIKQPNPIIEKVKEEPQPELKREEPKPQEIAKPEPKQEEQKPEPKREESPQPKPEPKATTTTTFNEDYDPLFEVKIATDLSQKLSAAPIADLSKALGLNEKFLYINELFGGDVNTFQATMQKLNEFDNIDQARAYLEKELIEKHEWNSKKERKPVAKNFIKLISRRYL